MIRIKRGNVANKRRKKMLKLAKGFVGSNSKLSTFAGEQIIQSFYFSYIGRKLKKRNFRSIWISRINAACRLNDSIYSIFLGKLKKLNIFINKKILALLSYNDLSTFNYLQNIALGKS
jgi:large subunit ribosomal protein L20